MSLFILRVPEHPPVEGDDLTALIAQGEQLAADTAETWSHKPAGHRNCQWTIQAAAKSTEVDMGVVARGIVTPDRKRVIVRRGSRKDTTEYEALPSKQ